MRLIIFQPDIPQNVGAAMRLAACFGVGLDIIGPCPFALTDKGMRRAAMDYGGGTDIRRHDGFPAYQASRSQTGGRLILLTTKGAQRLWDMDFAAGDHLMLGSESAGAPDAVHAKADERVRIPLNPGARSLNLVTAGAIALAEAARQGAIAGLS